ncbi:MAG: DUF5320 domain-containing protein [Tenuifilaceae bacterium]
MPNLNQTGPMGQGPMTGRRMGKCTNFDEKLKQNDPSSEEKPTNENIPQTPNRGRGFGLGRGGRGRRLGRQNRFRGGL